MKFVQGVGINDKSHSVLSKEYKTWAEMIRRCFDDKLHQREPSYKECTVAKEFRRLSDFSSWAKNQVGFGVLGFELDKDILHKGNKDYHPDKCVFLPREINSLLKTRKKSRGLYPVGVSTGKKSTGYIAQLNNKKEKIYLGTHPTPELAFEAYKKAKEQAIKDMANKWREHIDPRSYDALMSYQVEITD